MFARWLMVVLAATALAPIGLVWALKLRTSDPCLGLGLLVAALVLVGISQIFFRVGVPRYAQVKTVDVQKIESMDKDVLSFLLAYMLPLMTQKEASYDWWVVGAVVALILVVLWQAQLIHVNPLLGVIGYHFYKISTASGQSVLLITRDHSLTAGERAVYRISEVLWYDHQGKEPQQDDPRAD